MTYRPSKWQQEFHTCGVDFLLGAGSAGPGKTTALVMDPLQQIITEHQRCADKAHPYPVKWGQSRGWALHVRRELTQLEETIVNAQRLYQDIDPNVNWESKSNTLVFASGYRLQFGHCQNSDDHRKYLSRSFTHLALDEVSEFEKKQVDGLRSRVRSSDPVLRRMLKTRACTNPGVSPGQHPHWVREMFVDPHPSGRKILEKKLKRRDGTLDSYTYMYLPALLYDNPDAQFVADYELKLLDLPEHIRKAYLEGDWYHQAGAYFASDFDHRIHVVRPYPIPKDWPKFRSMDWGFKSPGCVTWWAMDDDGNMVCFEEFNFKEMVDVDVASRIKDIEKRLGMWDTKTNESRITGPADNQIWEDRGNSAERIIDVFMKAGVRWEQADKSPGSRRAHAERVLKRLKGHYGRTQLPGIMWFENCTKCITTIPQIPADPNNPDEPKKGGWDHAYDTCLLGSTLVDVPGGRVRLDSLKPGDEVTSTDGRAYPCGGWVNTRHGAPVFEVALDSGESLVATGDHRILCADGVWRRVDSLDATTYAFAPWTQSSFQRHARSSLESGTTAAGTTSDELRSASAEAACYTETCSPRTSERFRMATMSTTRATTPATTAPATCGLCSAMTTSAITVPDRGRESPSMARKRLAPGMQALMGSSGTERTRGSADSESSSLSSGRVHAAEAASWTEAPRGKPWLAPALASLRSEEHPGKTTSSEYALPAGQRSWPTGSRVSRPAHGSAVRVVGVRPAGTADVGCISVPGMGAFVASGIVVSNCAYACAYATRGAENVHMSGDASESDEWSRWANRGADTDPDSRWGLGFGYR